MANPIHGSSFSQTRRTQHNHLHHVHNHQHHVPSTDKQPLELRHERPSDAPGAVVTQVVQTVSLIQIVDSLGAPLTVETFVGAPATVLLDSAGLTVDASIGLDPLTPAVTGILSAVASEITAPLPAPVLSEVLDPLTSTPSSSSSLAFHTLTRPYANQSFFTNGSSLRNFTFTNSATLLPTSMSSILSTLSSTSAFTSDNFPVPTQGSENGATAGGTGTAGTTAAPTSDNKPPPAGTVAGGVVGGLAGMAVILLLILYALNWRKRKGSLLLEKGTNLLTQGPGGSTTGGAMAERAHALRLPVIAGLAGYKRFSDKSEPTEGGERGFYKVSGKKLPSVLQNGGDGFVDPRESVMSGTSSHYRESRAFEPTTGPGGLPVLALGSPMRPVSGTPIMRSGPARTPVTTQEPPDSPTLPLDCPSPLSDTIWRSVSFVNTPPGSGSGSASGSRFTEDI